MTYNPREALLNRMRVTHVQWQRVLDDMTLDQVNHHERAGVLPIAFSLLHYVTGEDRGIAERVLGEPPIWDSADWAGRIGVNVPSVRRGTPIEVAETVRFADLDAWRAYQSAVFARTEEALAAMPDARWDEVVFERAPETMQGGFLALVAGDGPVRLGDLLDVFLYQHGIRHIGEIEHARSLVGLEGVA